MRYHFLQDACTTGNNLMKALQLFKTPVMRPDEVARATGLSAVSAYKLIADFEKLGILKEITGSQRNRVFIFKEYIDVFQ